MRRDWDLVREILIQVGESVDPLEILDVVGTGYPMNDIAHHFYILKDAGLLEIEMRRGVEHSYDPVAIQLTWQGNELLDAIIDLRSWENLKTVAEERGVPLSLDFIKTLAARALDKMP